MLILGIFKRCHFTTIQTGLKYRGERETMDQFSISNTADGSDAAAALYKEELNDLKIEKLGNRITLISFLLPCLIGAILAYAYFDFKNRVTVLQDSGFSHVESMVKDFEVKINTIEVDLAKMKFSLEKEIPELNAQTTIIMEKLAALSDRLDTKIDREATETALTNLEAGLKNGMSTLTERMDTISGQHQTALNILDRTSKETLDIVNQNAKNLEHRMENRIDEKIASAIDTAFDDKLSTYATTMEQKVTDLSTSVESKLASLHELTQVAAVNKKEVDRVEKRMTEMAQTLDRLKEEQQSIKAEQKKRTAALEATAGGLDKGYVDRKVATGEERLTKKIDQLDLKIAKEIIKLKVAIDSQQKQGESGVISERDLVE